MPSTSKVQRKRRRSWIECLPENDSVEALVKNERKKYEKKKRTPNVRNKEKGQYDQGPMAPRQISESQQQREDNPGGASSQKQKKKEQ